MPVLETTAGLTKESEYCLPQTSHSSDLPVSLVACVVIGAAAIRAKICELWVNEETTFLSALASGLAL